MPTESSQFGSDELIKEFERINSELNAEVKRKLTEVGERVMTLAIEKTPKTEKKLIKGYKVTNPKQSGENTISAKVTNTEAGFEAMETGCKKIDDKGHVYGYVPGKHMLENAYTQVEKSIAREFEEVIKKVIG